MPVEWHPVVLLSMMASNMMASKWTTQNPAVTEDREFRTLRLAASKSVVLVMVMRGRDFMMCKALEAFTSIASVIALTNCPEATSPE